MVGLDPTTHASPQAPALVDENGFAHPSRCKRDGVNPQDEGKKVSAIRSEHLFPKRIYSPVGGWVLTMFLVLLECSYIGSLCYEISVQYQSPIDRVFNAPWIALFVMWPAMVFVIVVGTIPATICYIVLRASSLKRRLTPLTRLWTGGVFGAATASLFYAVAGFAPDHWQEAAPIVVGFVDCGDDDHQRSMAWRRP